MIATIEVQILVQDGHDQWQGYGYWGASKIPEPREQAVFWADVWYALEGSWKQFVPSKQPLSLCRVVFFTLEPNALNGYAADWYDRTLAREQACSPARVVWEKTETNEFPF